MRIERSGPPYAADGALDYSESQYYICCGATLPFTDSMPVEDPFSILSVFLPEAPTKPMLTPLYPSTDSRFPGPSTVPFNRQVYVDLDPPAPKPSSSHGRKHWSIQRNAPSRRRENTNDSEETVPPWKAAREHHPCDYGTSAILQEQLAREYGLTDVGHSLGSETQLFTAIRRTVDRGIPVNPAHANDDLDLTEEGYWARRGRQAEDYLKDMVYGGVDGQAYVRSLAEFVHNPDVEVCPHLLRQLHYNSRSAGWRWFILNSGYATRSICGRDSGRSYHRWSTPPSARSKPAAA
jgi:bromodomain-containing protein 7